MSDENTSVAVGEYEGKVVVDLGSDPVTWLRFGTLEARKLGQALLAKASAIEGKVPAGIKKPFTESFDAVEWAKGFQDVIKDHPDVPTDEGAMLVWFANALMRGHDHALNRAVRPSEAIFLFCAWVTTRKEVIKVGADEDAAIIPALISEFCDSQQWEEPRDHFEERAKPYPPT